MSTRVLIAGGGIGGVATAVALSQQGYEPIILEQAAELAQVGAGLTFPPNAVRVVEYLGCSDDVLRTAVPLDRMTYVRLDDGQPIRSENWRELAALCGRPVYSIHRADLLGVLLSRLPDTCVQVKSHVVGFEETTTDVRVELANGREIRGDVLIGADGLNSVVRGHLLGAETASSTGLAAWRGIVPFAASLHGSVVPEMRVAAGHRGSILMYPIRSGTLLNFVAVVFSADEREASWTLRGEPNELRAAFAHACDDVVAVLNLVDETLVTVFYDRRPLPAWGTARVTLLGDAAHPTSPSTGAGAAMALEDAITLAHCLKKYGTDIKTGLKEYESRRRPRTTQFLLQARYNNAEQFESRRNPIFRAAFDGKAQGMAQLHPHGDNVRWTHSGWLWGFDPAASLERDPEESSPPGWEAKNVLRREEARAAFDMWINAFQFDDRFTWIQQRLGYERFLTRIFPPSSDLQVQEITCNGVGALKVTPDGTRTDGPLILHLHGGGFVLGSARSSVEIGGRLARAVNGAAVVVDYALAPETAYPAALNDVLTTYRWLLDQHGGSDRIILTGEDAGGGLAVSVACALKATREQLPAALYVISPLCDLALSAESIDKASDPWLNRDVLRRFSASYIQATSPLDPLVSPAYADLSGLPPLLIHAAEDEALVDDARQLAISAVSAGVDVSLRTIPDTVHSSVLFDFLPETKTALHDFASFVERITSTCDE